MDQIPHPDEHEARRFKNLLTLVPPSKLMPSNQEDGCRADKLSTMRNMLEARRRSIIFAASDAKDFLCNSSIRQIVELQIAITAIESVEKEDPLL